MFTPFLQAAAPFGQFNPHHAPEDASLKHRRDPRFPTPDRSDLPRNFVKTADNDTLDIGWDEGVLRDGRPDVVEARCQDQVAMLTFFWSTDGMENATSEELG